MTFDDAFPEIDAIPGWYTKDELRLLWDAAARVPEGGRILEIGCQYGRSAKCILMSTKAKFIAVDSYLEDVSVEAYSTFRKNTGMFSEICLFIRTSDDFFKDLADSVLPYRDVNLVHIDGGHDLEQVYRDATNASQYVPVGGQMVFHDYGRESLSGVQKAVDWWHSQATGWRRVQLVDTAALFERYIR